MSDLIDREKAIEQMSLYGSVWMDYTDDMTKEQVAEKALRASKQALIEVVKRLPSAQPEPLTDKEQRIFLAAMERERKVCKEVDDQYVHEPYEVLLTKVCDEIERKVKKALWT